jgi:hypothetical protein
MVTTVVTSHPDVLVLCSVISCMTLVLTASPFQIEAMANGWASSGLPRGEKDPSIRTSEAAEGWSCRSLSTLYSVSKRMAGEGAREVGCALLLSWPSDDPDAGHAEKLRHIYIITP